jgi:hypothetical protein
MCSRRAGIFIVFGIVLGAGVVAVAWYLESRLAFSGYEQSLPRTVHVGGLTCVLSPRYALVLAGYGEMNVGRTRQTSVRRETDCIWFDHRHSVCVESMARFNIGKEEALARFGFVRDTSPLAMSLSVAGHHIQVVQANNTTTPPTSVVAVNGVAYCAVMYMHKMGAREGAEWLADHVKTFAVW